MVISGRLIVHVPVAALSSTLPDARAHKLSWLRPYWLAVARDRKAQADEAARVAAELAAQEAEDKAALSRREVTTMRVELIGHFEPCMAEIYLHIDARVADYIRTHP